MISSGGTRNGMSFCGSGRGEHAAVAAPAVAATRRNVRRLTPGGCALGAFARSRERPPASPSFDLPGTRSSLVAGPAVGGRLALVLRLPVALEAPAHGERGHLADRLHLLHLAVARAALELRVHDVALVREEDVVGDAVDARPLHRLALV